MSEEGFWRDAGGRLTFGLRAVPRGEYDAVAASIAAAFDLSPCGAPLAAGGVVFQEYVRDQFTLSLDWDRRAGLSVVARGRDAEPLAREIAAYLLGSGWGGTDTVAGAARGVSPDSA